MLISRRQEKTFEVPGPVERNRRTQPVHNRRVFVRNLSTLVSAHYYYRSRPRLIILRLFLFLDEKKAIYLHMLPVFMFFVKIMQDRSREGSGIWVHCVRTSVILFRI